MISKRLRLALALVAISYASAALAQSTVEAPAGSGQRFQGVTLINPTTGQPYSASGGGGGGTVTQGPAGTSPWLTTIYQGGNALSATNPIFTQLTAGSAPIGSITNTAFGISGSLPAGSNTIGSIANITGTVPLPAGASTSALQSNVQSAPGTSAGTAFTVQGSTSGVPLPVSGTVTSPTGATMTTSQPTVTTSAGQLTFAGSVHRELVNPPGNSTIYIGGSSGVTTTTGYPIFQGTSYDVTRFTGSVYAIGTASQTIGLISY